MEEEKACSPLWSSFPGMGAILALLRPDQKTPWTPERLNKCADATELLNKAILGTDPDSLSCEMIPYLYYSRTSLLACSVTCMICSLVQLVQGLHPDFSCHMCTGQDRTQAHMYQVFPFDPLQYLVRTKTLLPLLNRLSTNVFYHMQLSCHMLWVAETLSVAWKIESNLTCAYLQAMTLSFQETLALDRSLKSCDG